MTAHFTMCLLCWSCPCFSYDLSTPWVPSLAADLAEVLLHSQGQWQPSLFPSLYPAQLVSKSRYCILLSFCTSAVLCCISELVCARTTWFSSQHSSLEKEKTGKGSSIIALSSIPHGSWVSAASRDPFQFLRQSVSSPSELNLQGVL